jgi:hypothetical protein
MPDDQGGCALLQMLWEMHCSKGASLGLNMPLLWSSWATIKKDSLREWGADKSFDELCNQGCTPIPLAMTVELFRPLQSLETKWRAVTGSKRQREQKIHALERAANALEILQRSIADVVTSDLRESFDADLLEWFRKEIINPSTLDKDWDLPVPHPATTIRALRLYASTLRMFEFLSAELQIDSTTTLAKYLISAYVEKATGTFHDANVSSLIGASMKTTYEETAHRMWRSRNYQRINSELSWSAPLLVAFGVITSPKRNA